MQHEAAPLILTSKLLDQLDDPEEFDSPEEIMKVKLKLFGLYLDGTDPGKPLLAPLGRLGPIECC